MSDNIYKTLLKDMGSLRNAEEADFSGMDDFFVNLDEQFNVELTSPSDTTVLFKTLAVHDKNEAIGGWCRDQGKGRVVGLLQGHEHWIYRMREYQDIFWRSAHWAMKCDIPSYPA